MIYKFRENYWLPIDAETVGKRVEHLIEKNHGSITPEIVLEDAKPKDSPLHTAFTWDDSKAAHRHRLDEARYLIRSYVIVEVPTTSEESGTYTVAVPQRQVESIEEDGQRVYKTINDIMADPVLRARLLEEALAKLKLWKDRYKNLTELAEVYSAIDHVTKVKPVQSVKSKKKKAA